MSYAVSKSTRGYGRNAGHRWRADDLAQLRRLVRQGAALSDMSLKLGRPVPAIRSKAQSIGLHLDDGPPHRPARAMRKAVRPEVHVSTHNRPEKSRQLELF